MKTLLQIGFNNSCNDEDATMNDENLVMHSAKVFVDFSNDGRSIGGVR